MFMRIAVPELGPLWMLVLRLFSAALFLFLVTRFVKEALQARDRWKHYLFLGIFNTALPFMAFAWALASSFALRASALAWAFA